MYNVYVLVFVFDSHPVFGSGTGFDPNHNSQRLPMFLISNFVALCGRLPLCCCVCVYVNLSEFCFWCNEINK